MTPDNAGQTVLADLDRLEAKATSGRWAYYTAKETAAWKGYPEEEHWPSICSDDPPQHLFDLTLDDEGANDANGRYTVHACNHLRPLVAALEEMRRKACLGCADPKCGDREDGKGHYWHWQVGTGKKPHCDAPDAREALAALQRDISADPSGAKLGEACTCVRMGELSAKEWAEREPCGANCAALGEA